MVQLKKLSSHYIKKTTFLQTLRTYLSKSEADTKKLAGDMAKKLPNGGLLSLKGELGSGKTVFSKGFAAALGIPEKEIKSPTYTFVREYPLKHGTLYHFDFYRIESLDELMETDLRDILSRTKTWILIEWPERVAKVLQPNSKVHPTVQIEFDYVDPSTRRIKVKT